MIIDENIAKAKLGTPEPTIADIWETLSDEQKNITYEYVGAMMANDITPEIRERWLKMHDDLSMYQAKALRQIVTCAIEDAEE